MGFLGGYGLWAPPGCARAHCPYNAFLIGGEFWGQGFFQFSTKNFGGGSCGEKKKKRAWVFFFFCFLKFFFTEGVFFLAAAGGCEGCYFFFK